MQVPMACSANITRTLFYLLKKILDLATSSFLVPIFVIVYEFLDFLCTSILYSKCFSVFSDTWLFNILFYFLNFYGICVFIYQFPFRFFLTICFLICNIWCSIFEIIFYCFTDSFLPSHLFWNASLFFSLLSW